jgi:hypothetical protein
MANLGFSIRASLGLIPGFEKLESAQHELSAEWEKLSNFTSTDIFKEYLELKDKVNSESFKQKKAEILALAYKGSEPYGKELRFRVLEKDKRLKNYFHVLGSENLKRFNQTDSSEALKQWKLIG